MASIRIGLGVAPRLLNDLVSREIGLHTDLALIGESASLIELAALLALQRADAVVVTTPKPIAPADLDRLLGRHPDVCWFVMDERGHVEQRRADRRAVSFGEMSTAELIRAVRECVANLAASGEFENG